MTRLVEVQQLLGARVRDAGGRVAGRLESIRAEIDGPRCVVREYHLGGAALLSRLGMDAARLIGVRLAGRSLRVPWEQMDLAHADGPRLRITLDELKALQDGLPPFEDEGPPARMRNPE